MIKSLLKRDTFGGKTGAAIFSYGYKCITSYMYKDIKAYLYANVINVLICEHINMCTRKRTNTYMCMGARGISDVTLFSPSSEDEN